MTYNELEQVFCRWLNYNREPNELLISVATVLANRLDSCPVWVFLVGPSSSGKTVILKSMDGAEEIYTLSIMTANALVSGYRDKKTNENFSILGELDNKTVIIKDFTAMLSMKQDTVEAIFGQLRDAYDGSMKKATGTGTIERRAKFGLIAGSTLVIEEFRKAKSLLGERFLYYIVEQEDDAQTKQRVADSVGVESNMTSELNDAMTTFLNGTTIPCEIRIPNEVKEKLMRWSSAVVLLRTPVQRDSHTREIIVPVMKTELSLRFLKQTVTLYHALEFLVSRERAIRVIKKMCANAVPSVRVLTLKSILLNMEKKNALKYVKVSSSTLTRTVEDLRMLGVLDFDTGKVKQEWNDVLNELLVDEQRL